MTTKEDVPEAVNWLGETIRVGDHVYRGARQGNASTFKVGTVEKITRRTQPNFSSDYVVRVNWRFSPGLWLSIPGEDRVSNVYRHNTYGNPDLNTLVLVSKEVWDHLESVAITPEALTEG